jgi:hypothetical protein
MSEDWLSGTILLVPSSPNLWISLFTHRFEGFDPTHSIMWTFRKHIRNLIHMLRGWIFQAIQTESVRKHTQENLGESDCHRKWQDSDWLCCNSCILVITKTIIRKHDSFFNCSRRSLNYRDSKSSHERVNEFMTLCTSRIPTCKKSITWTIVRID